MKITIESTEKIVELLHSERGQATRARVWQGFTESGIPVQVFVARIAPEVPQSDQRIEELTAEFKRELQRCADPRPSVEAIPMRLII